MKLCVCIYVHASALFVNFRVVLFFFFSLYSLRWMFYKMIMMTQNSSNLSDRHKLFLNLSIVKKKWIPVIAFSYDKKQCLYGHSFFWLERPLVIVRFLLLFQGYWLTWWTRLIECTCSSWLLPSYTLNINKSGTCICFLSLNKCSLDIYPLGMLYYKCTFKLFINNQLISLQKILYIVADVWLEMIIL